MRSQFVKLNGQEGNANVPQHIAAMNGWSPMPAGNGSTENQSQTNLFPPNEGPRRPSTGLLSGSGMTPNWNAGSGQTPPHPQYSQHLHYPQHPQYSQQPGYDPMSIAEQETQRQRATQRPAWQGGQMGQMAQSVNPQAFMYGPVSPRESGITPFSTMYANGQMGQMQQNMQAPPMQPPAVQPFSPSSRYGPNIGISVMPMPGMPSAPLQAMGYPGTGEPPFVYQPMPPGNDGRGGEGRKGRKGKRPKKKRRFPIWARVLVSIFLLLLLAVGGLFTYYQVEFAPHLRGIVGQTASRFKGEEDPNQGRTGDILSGPRINILLLGSDTDQKFGSTAGGSTIYLAQTDIVITIDPTSKQVGMLSIPRDFYINIPGYGLGKLDEAFEHGYSTGQGGFAGAVALSRLTIEQDFGIPINYYAWVGLDGFIKVIDTVNGVDLDVLHPITDASYPDDVGSQSNDPYAFKRLYIVPGPQHLSGTEALEYVRSRHADLVGDFGRSARQQQVLSALKTKLNNPDIISKLPDLAADLDGSVKTDMQLTDVLKLMNFARGLDPNKIQRIILAPPFSSSGTLPNGESIVEPHCDQIIPAIAQMFDLGSKAACNIQANSNHSSNSALATVSQTSSIAGASSSTGTWQTTTQFASTSVMSIGQNSDSMLGFQGLLDLVFAVVFETPQAMQV